MYLSQKKIINLLKYKAKPKYVLSKLTRMDTSVSDESSCVANAMALGLDGFDNVISCAPVIKRIHKYIKF